MNVHLSILSKSPQCRFRSDAGRLSRYLSRRDWKLQWFGRIDPGITWCASPRLAMLGTVPTETRMHEEKAYFVKESPLDRVFNRFFGLLVRWGVGAKYNYLLETKGRKTGRAFTTPVNLTEIDGKLYLVAVRGETGWVRNARAAGSILLRKGSTRLKFRVREVAVNARPPILKEFLERYASQVQRFYPVPKGSPVEAFREMAPRAPVFELQE